MPISFPNEEDFRRIGKEFPYHLPLIKTEDVLSILLDQEDMNRFMASFDTITWTNGINTRISHVRRSYIFMRFYIEQGAPDHIDFDKYENDDFLKRDYFYYFADVFFHKIFSTWDIIGHILTLAFRLHLTRPDFEKVVNKLKLPRPEMHLLYSQITTDSKLPHRKRWGFFNARTAGQSEASKLSSSSSCSWM